MKNYRNIIVFTLLILLAIPLQIKAHEEPSKTLKEKKAKEQKKQQVFKAKIKTATVWKYTFENKTETANKQKALIMGYDARGNFISIEAYKNDSLTERDEYSYSSNGNMLSDIDFSPNGKLLEKNVFAYDKEGRVISGISTNEKDSVTGYFKILNDKDRKLQDFVNYYSGDSSEYKITYKYTGDFDKYDYSEACKYDSKGKLMMKVEKQYNAEEQQVKKIIYDSDQKVKYYFQYEYDQSGSITKITKNTANDEVEWEDNYTFDDFGNTTEIKSNDKDKNLTAHLIYEFEFYK